MTHVGKLYNLAAERMAEALVAELPELREAQCYLVSQIGLSHAWW
jgi:S-adenosylmethionine synthetase